jgi:hypothetical protein
MSSLRDIESLILLLYFTQHIWEGTWETELGARNKIPIGILGTVRAFIGIGKDTEWNWKGNINLIIISYYGETEKCFLARF